MTEPAASVHTRREARSAKAEVVELFAGTSGVVGVGLQRVPDGGWCVRVNVTTVRVAQAVASRVAAGVRGVPVQVRVTGAIETSGPNTPGPNAT